MSETITMTRSADAAPGRSFDRSLASTPERRALAIHRLEAEVAEVAGVINAAHGRLVSLVARALHERLWEQEQVHSPEQWVAWQLGLSASHARQVVAVARRAHELPAASAALAAGSLSVDQAVVIARHCPADHEQGVTEFAKAATVPQLARTLRRYAFEPPAPPPDEGAAAREPTEGERRERREVWFGATDEHRWRLHADLPIDEGALVERALVAARGDLFALTSSGGDADRTVTWADALVSLAEADLAAGAARLPGADRYTVIAHLETRHDDVRPEADSGRAPPGPGVLSVHLGLPLPDNLRRFVTCDCAMRLQIDRDGIPLSVGRKQPTVPDRLRHAIEHRDGGCRVPGCHRTRHLHIHHIRHWEHGGPTDTDNLVALCRPHHRLHHVGGLGIEGHADQPDVSDRSTGLRFSGPDGRPLVGAGRPRAPGQPAAAAAAHLGIWAEAYAHPLGERLCRWAVQFAPNPPAEATTPAPDRC